MNDTGRARTLPFGLGLLAIGIALGLTFVLGVTVGTTLEPSPEEGPAASTPVRAKPKTSEPEASATADLEPESKPTSPESLPSSLTEDERRTIEVFRDAAASVVSIRAMDVAYDPYSRDAMRIPRGSGSGFIWDDAGHVVTNFHVIEKGRSFIITMEDGSSYDGTVVGAAPHKDLAVLKIDPGGATLKALPIGRSTDLVVGQRVLAVGNPFGLDQTLTVGVLSALGRELRSPGGRTIHDVLQTDAAINPGNSGGPLLDSGGHLIGVSTAIYSPSGASAGIGFAIPADTVRRLIPQLIEHGHPIQPGIGVSLLPDQTAKRFGISGVVVWEVGDGGPAEAAGIEGVRRSRDGISLRDILVGANGTRITTAEDLLDVFEATGVGGSVTLAVERDGARREVKVTLVRIK